MEIEAGLRIYSTPALSHDEETIYFGGYDRKLYSVNKSMVPLIGLITSDLYWFAAVDDNGVFIFSIR